MINRQVVVFDLETIPDLAAYKRAEHLPELSDEEAKKQLGEKFPKLPIHSIACIGAVIADKQNGAWRVKSIGAPHIGERDESALLDSFFGCVGTKPTTLVSFNGHGFDLPVLRYRAMLHRVSGRGLERANFFNRYAKDSVDLCDVLSSFDARGKMSLDALCRIMEIGGKPNGISGKDVATFVAEGKIGEVAAYCETDVINTYRLWLRYELFAGGLNPEEYDTSEADLHSFLKRAVKTKPHLQYLVESSQPQTCSKTMVAA